MLNLQNNYYYNVIMCTFICFIIYTYNYYSTDIFIFCKEMVLYGCQNNDIHVNCQILCNKMLLMCDTTYIYI